MSRRPVSLILGGGAAPVGPVLEQVLVPVRGKRPAAFVGERLLSLMAEDEADDLGVPGLAFSFDLYLGEDDRPIAVVTRRLGTLTPLALVVAVGDDAADLRRQLDAIDPTEAEAIDISDLDAGDLAGILSAQAGIVRRLSRVGRLYTSLVTAALGDGLGDSRIAA